jgi:hypothetical protein
MLGALEREIGRSGGVRGAGGCVKRRMVEIAMKNTLYSKNHKTKTTTYMYILYSSTGSSSVVLDLRYFV